MSEHDRSRPSIKTFDGQADRNGQNLGAESPLDVGIPSRTQADLKSEPNGEAEAARIASGQPRQDASDQTAAETPSENLRRISDPSTASAAGEGSGLKSREGQEAINRATAALGEEGQ
ncbi:hypothetical protein [Methylobacterium gnaphalii]|uniref:Uncharacterized protein n=1 Tax=Methylobacterium gnaphalii TaxID=1010610 RepID=A0A512JM51_9HYPH|nr:hypothetical protein [Methylobacterium gnaphalii]GEP11035.1 hypothetical protein MGN01_28800 [Methylobacterium gnaphalii]GJD69625.1 hypothetical protein MMMDOFMJ_2562 [Methylobacterium gnaphalii]GLS50313.1 hypothetical protein GCM10007885_31650 [Methylobacterium gnaphalii]